MEKPEKGLSNYKNFTMFYDDMHEEPNSFKWGHTVMDICKENKIPFKTTYPPDAPECTIWVKYGFVKKLRAAIKKEREKV